MAILSLCTASFRNLLDCETDTSARDIFLIGENGQGKTNFLEALYFCAYASSFRGAKDGDMASCEKEIFSAAAALGPLSDSEFTDFSRVAVTVEHSRKTINLNGKKIEDRKDLLKMIPCVAFCHEDMDFVYGSQERRRWFFDQTQSLYDPVYLDDLRKYRRVLKNRNAVLKEAKMGGDYRRTMDLLDVLDPQLVEYGISLMEKRRAAADRFSAVFNPLYEEVSGIAGICVAYVPSWKNAGTNSAVCSADDAARRLAERRQADIAQGISLSGPHRDKYLFLQKKDTGPAQGQTIVPSGTTAPAGAAEFSLTASTGQRRLLALLLRSAQARCFSDLSGKTPVLLLDDVLLELDGEKRRRFLSVMPAYEQAFFTFLPEEPYKSYSKSGTMVYHMKNGALSR